MKLFDCFLFSEPMEANLLLVKFNLEKDFVHRWVLCESPYTFQGEYKGCHAAKLLSEDKRFAEFLDRIIIVNPAEGFQPLHGNTNDEGKNFERENSQRAMCLDYILKVAADNDWIMISDTDEAVDFADKTRSEVVQSLFNVHKHVFKLQRTRYWYDFDNRCYLNDIHIPFVNVGVLRQNPQFINARHFDHIQKVNFNEGKSNDDYAVAFEYSYCFPSLQDVWRKKCTYSHTGFTLNSVEEGLSRNHWPRSALRGEKVEQESDDFFEFVTLTRNNSPQYVRDNLSWLKTNIVSPDYKQNRENAGLIAKSR